MFFIVLFHIAFANDFIIKINQEMIPNHINYERISDEHVLVDKQYLTFFQEFKHVQYIEHNKILKTHSSCEYSWGPDRVNQINLPLDHFSDFSDIDSSNIDIYVLDTGINLDHPQFSENKPIPLKSFGSDNPNDCDGHGTHVTGIISGKDIGVIPDANIFSIKISHDCTPNSYCSDMIKAIDLVHKRMIKTGRKSIINLSFGVCNSVTTKLNAFMESGGIVSLSSGNDGIDITDVEEYSNFDYSRGFIVGSTDFEDKLSTFSNYGDNVFIYSPGSSIPSADYNHNDCIFLSGTSMAAPLVTAITALYWEDNYLENNIDIIRNLIKYSNKDKINTLDDIKINNNLLYLPSRFDKKTQIYEYVLYAFLFCCIIFYIGYFVKHCCLIENINILHDNAVNFPHDIIESDIENDIENADDDNHYNQSVVIQNFDFEGKNESIILSTDKIELHDESNDPPIAFNNNFQIYNDKDNKPITNDNIV